MARGRKNYNHQEFIDTAGEIIARLDEKSRIVITREEAAIIAEHLEWFNDYRQRQSRRGSLAKNPGRKPKPAADIKPESLKMREYRARKAKEKEK